MTVKKAVLAASGPHFSRRFAENLFSVTDGVGVVRIDNNDTAFVPASLAESGNINDVRVRLAHGPHLHGCQRRSGLPSIKSSFKR